MRKIRGGIGSRDKLPHFAGREFLIMYTVLSMLSVGQWMIYSMHSDFAAMSIEYFGA